MTMNEDGNSILLIVLMPLLLANLCRGQLLTKLILLVFELLGASTLGKE